MFVFHGWKRADVLDKGTDLGQEIHKYMLLPR